MESWHDFFLAEVGASAALAGLVFVGVSINIKDILNSPHLVDRALETVLELLLVLLVASVVLVPHQTSELLGGEITLLALIGAGVLAYLQARNWKTVLPEYRSVTALFNALVMSVPVPLVVGGVGLWFGNEWGIGVVAFGILLAFVVTIYSAWVLLIEILR